MLDNRDYSGLLINDKLLMEGNSLTNPIRRNQASNSTELRVHFRRMFDFRHYVVVIEIFHYGGILEMAMPILGY